MERVRFCRRCGESFPWDLASCSSCGHAVRSRRARASAHPTGSAERWLTAQRIGMALLFLAVIAFLWLLSSVPTWLID